MGFELETYQMKTYCYCTKICCLSIMTSENTRKSIYGIRKHHSQLKRLENLFKNQYTDSFDSSGNISNENLLLLYKNMLLVDDGSILTIIIIAIDHVLVRYMKLRLGYAL